MHVTHQEIAKIAEWDPTQACFGRSETKTRLRIQTIAEGISSSADLGCDILKEDGLSNYFVLFAYMLADVPPFPLARKIEGLLIYLSACAPLGVLGWSRRCVAPGISSYDSLELETLLDPQNANGHLEEKTIEAIRAAGYELMSAREAGQPLPPGVRPYEYCLARKPWDRVFHAVFADTD